ncbi:hypothetical protein SAMN05446037_101239 [Anaerovirgula multivorans]|uniref:Permease n=1 Tax=Anaerovirgula multivorans TaxID=312168 RepID=A0A239F6Q0_9FIRM|nr:permease [Anaerovirgula multivorans]SNS52609.1 hypothetical protein SAMN05446037_101239 [Anaerovirgula multivorans]
MFTYILYIITIIFLLLSFVKDRKKTALALKKARNSFLAVLPQFLAILFLVGVLLTLLDSGTLQSIIGTQSGVKGMIFTSIVGSVTLVPVFTVLPIVSQLLKNGAGLMQIAVFICTLTTVGFVTMPLEIKFFGTKAALLRNILAYLFSFIVAFIIGVILT